jgi:hypothetical protein
VLEREDQFAREKRLLAAAERSDRAQDPRAERARKEEPKRSPENHHDCAVFNGVPAVRSKIECPQPIAVSTIAGVHPTHFRQHEREFHASLPHRPSSTE